MDRDSIIYYLRRRLQVFAYHIFTKEFLSKIYYFIMLRKKLHLKNPVTFNEKLQWYKLYYCPNNDLIIKCADKYTVREYLSDKGYDTLFPKLYGVWENVDSINFDELPNQFVLKCTHGCAYNILCKDKKSFNKEDAVNKLKTWLKCEWQVFF